VVLAGSAAIQENNTVMSVAEGEATLKVKNKFQSLLKLV
jgi:hypothetical protein